ncbi:MAG: AAA family ATPase [Chitinophagales bacterium]
MKNHEFELAEQFALQTAQSLFLTGKAGSGKTTLLRKIASATTKNVVIVAPTGAAAINAGGVTMHSMFGLPLTSFIPANDPVDPNICTNRRALLDHMKLRKEKIRVIREMDLLVIDEISMVRVDVLDAIDFILRTVRRIREPMGGVQVMFIGDMHQLPPVVRPNDWAILQRYYKSPYFFDSLVWQELNAVEIELKKIYRQSDERFLALLNNIRNQEMNEDDFELLKSRYQPAFEPKEEGYILLATHNQKADQVNDQELARIVGRTHFFEAEITGDFPENSYPCDKILQLKEGAQVMFIRNDSEDHQYFNGKLATIKKIEGDAITVTFQDDRKDFVLKRELWENVSYSVDETGGLEQKILGSFSQYPLRLAWAVTIHKSQGLTFDKVIIDAGKSFAAGQVYVALSRCRTLDGIVLHSLITPQALKGDERIRQFSEDHHSERELEHTLTEARQRYGSELLKKLFSFHKIMEHIEEWRRDIFEKDLNHAAAAMQIQDVIAKRLNNMNEVAIKFRRQIHSLSINFQEEELRERSAKAIDYFAEFLFTHYLTPLHAHAQDFAWKAKSKVYSRGLNEMLDEGWKKIDQLYAAKLDDRFIFEGERRFYKELLKPIEGNSSKKKESGSTYSDTLELYKKGIGLKEIAEVRGLALTTIKGHISKWIASGDIAVSEVLNEDVIRKFENFYQAYEERTYSKLKQVMGEDVDFGDAKMVFAHCNRKTNTAL